MKETEINQLRKKLDHIDDLIASLLSERIALAQSIVKIKKGEKIAVEDIQRESAIVERISHKNQDIAPLLQDIFRRIFDWVKSRERS